jgi:hypothetical protein
LSGKVTLLSTNPQNALIIIVLDSTDAGIAKLQKLADSKGLTLVSEQWLVDKVVEGIQVPVPKKEVSKAGAILPAATAAMQRQASEYETRRLENIAKNEEFLRSIGLSASGARNNGMINRSISTSDNNGNEDVKDAGVKRPRSRRVVKNEDDNEPNDDDNNRQYVEVRRSKRISNVPVEDDQHGDSSIPAELRATRVALKRSDVIYKEEITIDDDDEFPRIRITPVIVRNLIVSSNPDHDDLISNEQLLHCVHRVQSMSNKALGNRLKTIVRAAGQNSQEKLLVFYYTLLAAGLFDLAASVKIALESVGISFAYVPNGNTSSTSSISSTSASSGASGSNGKSAKNTKKRKTNDDMEEGVQSDEDYDEDNDTNNHTNYDIDGDVDRIPITKASVRELIKTSNREHSDMIGDTQLVHCVHRIQTMKNRALRHRIAVISRFSD